MAVNSNSEKDISAQIKSTYTSIIEKHGIGGGKFKNIKVNIPTLNGDNFTSSCDYVTIHQENGRKLELFAKRMVDNPGHTKSIRDLKFFEKEAGFFNTILPLFENFIQSRKQEGKEYELDFLSKCYYADDDHVMFENLVKKGYILLNKIDRQDFNAASTAMKSLAKFHAPSYLIIKEQGVGQLKLKYECLRDSFLIDGVENEFKGWIHSSIDAAEKILNSIDTEDGKYALKIIEKWRSNNLMKQVQACFQPDHGEICCVLNHGDFWNNNMMFLMDDSKNILHHVLVDFQIIRVGSPNLDLSYFMWTSLKHEVRQKQWLNLLKIYYDSLCLHVSTLAGTVDFSFEEFVEDYKRKFEGGFIFGICMTGSFSAYTDLKNFDQVDGDVPEYIRNVIDHWIHKNPAKTQILAHQLAQMFQDYKNLIQN